jgi:thiol-disulfide isomerase/thioredoxin
MINRLRERWRRFREHTWLSLAFDVAVLAVVFFMIQAWQTRHLPDNELAPVTELALLEGGRQSALRAGAPGIVYFFAPWCRVCRLSIGNLDDLVESGHVQWATVVALDYSDTDEVTAFIERERVSLPVLLGTTQTAADWSVRAFPTYYVIDSSGRIQSRSVGYSTWLGMWTRNAWAQ